MRIRLSNLPLLILLVLVAALHAQEQTPAAPSAEQLPLAPGKVITITPQPAFSRGPQRESRDPMQTGLRYA